MRDIFLALALAWCLWLTWDMHHNYKQDKRSNLIDKATLQVLKIHCNRLDKVTTRIEKLENYEDDQDELINSINVLLHKHIDDSNAK